MITDTDILNWIAKNPDSLEPVYGHPRTQAAQDGEELRSWEFIGWSVENSDTTYTDLREAVTSVLTSKPTD